MSIEMSGDVRGWFHERLVTALGRQRLSASESTQVYLVELLASFAQDGSRASIGRPLALQLADAQEAQGLERLRILRSMGDTALYVLGFFEDHIERRGLSRSYVCTMGGRAYSSAGSLAAFTPSEAVRQQVYRELAHSFESFVEAFDDVRESTQLRTPQDIVKLYERYKRTRSPKLAERLRAEGVFLQAPSDDTVLH